MMLHIHISKIDIANHECTRLSSCETDTMALQNSRSLQEPANSLVDSLVDERHDLATPEQVGGGLPNSQ